MKIEKQLVRAIDKLYNDYVGYNEIAYLDGDMERFKPFTLEWLIDTITSEIVNNEHYLELEESFEVLEAKHIRFLGKDNIKALVTGVCMRRKNEERWEWDR